MLPWSSMASVRRSSAERAPAYQSIVEQLVTDPTLSHVYYDISWDEVAKYAIASPEIEKRVAKLETVADILEKGRQRGLGILAGLALAAGIAGATLSQSAHDLLGKLLALLRGP